MFRRKLGVVQNDIVAYGMRRFFRTLKGEHRSEPETVAKIYSQLLWNGAKGRLVDEKRLSRSRFYVGLSTGDNFDELTKRVVLISDTLLLSHDWTGEYHHLDTNSHFGSDDGLMGPDYGIMCGIHCPSLAEVGRWILDAEPLLKAGLVWYLPSYSTSAWVGDEGALNPADKAKLAKAIDYLIRDGRAVDASGAEPTRVSLYAPCCASICRSSKGLISMTSARSQSMSSHRIPPFGISSVRASWTWT